ncbi:NACHT domain-containing protein [Spongiactinospora sp. TRM90649]|uniref:NACHT domain-containing protein n=1 Tax=Spongiactinospora sp. TRM90649 TaxID=3031114 RepID=UPI0023F98821|nr:NACHT domain-containing protein [Spongiactinospora sp. TRM90649]MDF5758239.1 NACHT domain-containing protein [Spongiactinospora sp. TRM90649]
MGLPSSRWATPLLWGGALLLGACLGALTLALRDRGLETAAVVAQLVSLPLTVVPLAVTLVAWWRRTRHEVTTPAQLAEAKEILARLVREQWEAEARTRSLGRPEPMPVVWRLAGPEVMDLPRWIGTATLRGRGDRIEALVREFAALRRRRLVITGPPGSGKTTLAVQLVVELLRPAGRDPDEPVPVLLTLTGWDTVEHPRLHDWLAARLAETYPALRSPAFGPGAARALAARGEILPVLDGLDELPPQARERVVTALNRSLGEADRLVLTCRTAEYHETVRGEVIAGAAVIEPEPLTAPAAAGYLEGCLGGRTGGPWERVLAELRAGRAPVLAAVTAGPLGLWLVRAVHIDGRRDPAVLLDGTRFASPAELRAHLLGELVPALVEIRPPSTDPAVPFRPRRAHDTATLDDGLTRLARHLSAAGTRDFAWWHLARRVLSPRLLGAMLGFVTGAAFGLTAGLTAGPAGAVPGGVAAGLLAGIVAPGWLRQRPGYADLRLRGRLGPLAARVGEGVAAGAVCGAVGGAIPWLGTDFGGIMAGALKGLRMDLVVRLPIGGEPPGMAGSPVRDAAYLTLLALAGGLPGAMTGALATALRPARTRTAARLGRLPEPLVYRVTLALAFGVAFGIPGGIAAGVALGVLNWADRPAPLTEAGTPASTLRADGRLALLRVVSVGVAAAVAARVSGGLTVVVPLGLAVGLLAGDRHAAVCYAASLATRSRRRLPSRLTAVLDDAHRLGLLRVVGPVYQFRHAELQDHFAAGGRPGGLPPTGVS